MLYSKIQIGNYTFTPNTHDRIWHFEGPHVLPHTLYIIMEPSRTWVSSDEETGHKNIENYRELITPINEIRYLLTDWLSSYLMNKEEELSLEIKTVQNAANLLYAENYVNKLECTLFIRHELACFQDFRSNYWFMMFPHMIIHNLERTPTPKHNIRYFDITSREETTKQLVDYVFEYKYSFLK